MVRFRSAFMLLLALSIGCGNEKNGGVGHEAKSATPSTTAGATAQPIPDGESRYGNRDVALADRESRNESGRATGLPYESKPTSEASPETSAAAPHDGAPVRSTSAIAKQSERLAATVNTVAPSSPKPSDPQSAPQPNVPGGVPAGEVAESLKKDADGEFHTEGYLPIFENDFLRTKNNPLSTFSIDVDTASYANVRRFLTGYQLPPAGAVRLEELINYFSYDYSPPSEDVPFATHVEAAECPWNTKHHLLRIGLKGKTILKEQRPVSNLVFLLDVSGSMNEPNKLPLVKESLKLLVGELTENDRIAICVYAGAAGLVLPSTTGDNKQTIISALDQLQAGGSTNGGQGIALAYATATQNFIKGGTNRVVLCTDGDFNVGVTSQDELVRMIQDKAKSGVFLSVLGFGQGNYKDSTMEMLADKGNGNYGYIDTLNEGRKVFVEQMTGTLITIAKDVKIQVDFNPKHVAAYRLLGYENRMLKAEDFKDDKKDAGEIGAGHTVTALYEIIPPGLEIPAGDVDPSKYETPKETGKDEPKPHDDEMLTVRLRYKDPDGEASKPLEFPFKKSVQQFDKTSVDFQFAAAVTQFGMLLRNSKYKGGANWDSVQEIAQGSLGADPNGYRAEFLDLVKKAKELSAKK